jgi:hypothetical protein
MLRISEFRRDEARVVRLEGKLLEPWVEEVQGLFAGLEVATLPELDLSGLSFVDRAGVEMLQRLQRQGVRINACSPFVTELIGEFGKPTR